MRIFVVHGFLSPEECDGCRALSEQAGSVEAPITPSTGFQTMKEYRSNDRVMLDDAALAQTVFQRLRPFLPPRRDA
ncbi:MAG: hypothetical protein FJX76_22690 [Armatimonadetes bacterium]|nr:hypothetical protein [Armatimonadota bacterium]